jgi:ABC-type molybdate transport system permease subunit
METSALRSSAWAAAASTGFIVRCTIAMANFITRREFLGRSLLTTAAAAAAAPLLGRGAGSAFANALDLDR